jgi:hypothetical protein
MTRLQEIKVFISYTDIDKHGKNFGARLEHTLKQNGYDVFFFDHEAKKNLGRPLWDVLAEEIDRREALIVVCSEAICASYGADFEYNHAMSREKLIIPLKYDNASVPSPLTSKIRDSPFDEATCNSRFESVVKGLPESYQKH